MDVKLVFFKSNGTQKTFSLPSDVTVIGRRQDCDLCIPLMPVSRRHCELDIEQEAIRLRDLGSQNGTFLNGKRIEETVINPGDYLQVGPVTFAFQVDGKPKNITLPDPSMIKPPLPIQSVRMDPLWGTGGAYRWPNQQERFGERMRRFPRG